jgi:hypothetical protein
LPDDQTCRSDLRGIADLLGFRALHQLFLQGPSTAFEIVIRLEVHYLAAQRLRKIAVL